jgi:hypothetical protein
LRILLTNNTLDQRAGTEIVVLELARALRDRGHLPVAYSSVLGEVAEEIRRAGIPVISDLEQLQVRPDIIHGQHHLDAMTAMLHFNDCPAIYVCHGWAPWEEAPPRFPNIMKYVAVGKLTRERLIVEAGASEADIDIVPNFVDVKQFLARAKIADKPRRAVIFSNRVTADSPFAKIVAAACVQSTVEKLMIVGTGAGRPTSRPEVMLQESDLVFAVGRSAIEALASGCGVIVAHPEGSGGLVTATNLGSLRQENFGLGSLDPRRLSVESLTADIAAYDPNEIERVMDIVRREMDLDTAVNAYLRVYDEAFAAWGQVDVKAPSFTERQLLETSRYFRGLVPHLKPRSV